MVKKMDILKKKKIGFIIAIAFIILFTGAVMVMNRHIVRKNLRPEGGTKFAKAVVKEVLSSQTEEVEEGEVEIGQVVAQIDKVESAAEIVGRIVNDYETVRQRMVGLKI